MIVKFARPYLSIQQFEEIELPELTVLTGVNGSGKTHLLEAIKEDAAVISGISSDSIAFFSYETFRLENESPFSAYDIEQDRISAFNFFDTNIRQVLRNIKGMIAHELQKIREKAQVSGVPYWSVQDVESMQGYRAQVLGLFGQPHVRQQPSSPALLSFLKSYPTTAEEITREEFERYYNPFLSKSDFLPQMIARVIWDYNVRLAINETNMSRNERYGANLPCVSAEAFVYENGEKPWMIMNRILKQFSALEYEISSPESLDPFKAYKLQLESIHDSTLKIDFGNLSSGERILMALVASVYKSASDKNFPELLLLDELDATLHPSMMKNLLGVISDVFVSRGTKVILVTHSPSTVAFAPEGSIFVVNKRGPKRVEKRSKKDALAILTEGFATLEEGMLLFDQVTGGRCSIITEGRNTRLLAEAFKHFSVDGVEIVDGLESMTGKNQLRTLFDFMCKVPHSQKVIFIWDCDVSLNLIETNNTYPVFMTRNTKNSLTQSGIENMFDDRLFPGFTKTITPSNRPPTTEFDEARKKDFELHILSRRNPDDFENFRDLAARIKSIRDRP